MVKFKFHLGYHWTQRSLKDFNDFIRRVFRIADEETVSFASGSTVYDEILRAAIPDAYAVIACKLGV